jgi:hypothetical protein
MASDAVATPGSKDFVPVAERVAVFDNDGTLVCEKPIAHGMFLLDRVKSLVERRPELAHEEPFTTLLTGDLDWALTPTVALDATERLTVRVGAQLGVARGDRHRLPPCPHRPAGDPHGGNA